MQPYRQVTDEEWARVEPLIPELKYNPSRDPRGRPMTSRRDCLNATIWVMYSGASWQTLPRKYPSYQTCHRSFKAWYDAGVLHRIAHTLFGASSEAFLEIVSARIRSGTKMRGAMHAQPRAMSGVVSGTVSGAASGAVSAAVAGTVIDATSTTGAPIARGIKRLQQRCRLAVAQVPAVSEEAKAGGTTKRVVSRRTALTPPEIIV